MTFHIFGNGTDTVGWQSGPQKRGTFDIITICIVTLLLCIWNAIHPNVPPRNKTSASLLKRWGFVMFALIMPEIIVFMAWCQRSVALQLMVEANEAFGLQKWSFWSRFRRKEKQKAIRDVEDNVERDRTLDKAACGSLYGRSSIEQVVEPSRSAWTPTHGFYVLMGGFGLKIPGILPEGQEFRLAPMPEHWAVSIEGFRLLLEDDKSKFDIPDISREGILDKSKASGALKLLICVQVIWFCAQVITRLAQGLAISLLELNTFGHCICALFIYILWWDKPQDVEQSHDISSDRLMGCRALCEMFKSTPNVSRTRDHMNELIRQNDYPKLKAWLDMHPREFPNKEIQLVSISDSEESSPENLEKQLRGRGQDKVKLECGEVLPQTGFFLPNAKTLPDEDVGVSPFFLERSLKSTLSEKLGDIEKKEWFLERPAPHIPPATAIDLDEKGQVRWRLAWKAIHSNAVKPRNLYRPVHALVEYSTNIPRLDQSFLSGLMLLLSGVLYGGLHALAWNANFMTDNEKLLWRISTCIIMCSGLGLALIFTTIILIENFIVSLRGVVYVLFVVTAFSVALCYLAARVYLIVECFLNLAHLPKSAYDLPNWSTFAPHIT